MFSGCYSWKQRKLEVKCHKMVSAPSLPFSIKFVAVQKALCPYNLVDEIWAYVFVIGEKIVWAMICLSKCCQTINLKTIQDLSKWTLACSSNCFFISFLEEGLRYIYLYDIWWSLCCLTNFESWTPESSFQMLPTFLISKTCKYSQDSFHIRFHVVCCILKEMRL